MSPLLAVSPRGQAQHIILRPSGELIIPADTIRQLAWPLGAKLAVSYFDSPLTLFLTPAKDEPG